MTQLNKVAEQKHTLSKKLEEMKELIAILLKERDSAVHRAVEAEKREQQVVKENAHLTNKLEKTKGELQDLRASVSKKRKIPQMCSTNKKARSENDIDH